MTALTKIISGGQTGVDRAALDAALEQGLPCGGWCPRGRRAEDGPIPARYPLAETPRREYPQRTERNIRNSDGTLVLTLGPTDRGTALTIHLAAQLGKPCLVLNLTEADAGIRLRQWLTEHGVGTLNVAGPRESRAPGIHAASLAFLREFLASGAASVRR